MLALLVFPIVFLLGLISYINQIIASLAFGLGTIVPLSLLFAPKAMILQGGGDVDKNLKVNKSAGSKVHDVEPDNNDTGELVLAKDLVRHGTLDERALLCRRQIEQWKALLMKTEERSSTGSHTNNGPSKSYSLQPQHLDDPVVLHQLEGGEKGKSIGM